MARPNLILRSCRFCGEEEHLSDGNSLPRAIIRDGDTVKDHEGREVLEEVSAACCLVCDSMAALDVWNGTRPEADYAVLRDFDPPALEARP